MARCFRWSQTWPFANDPAKLATWPRTAATVTTGQMRWTPTGAHHLLQIRTRVLDERLDHDINRWNQQTAAA
jgi:hypothetical protein